MRDLCKVLGVQLVVDERKKYLLGNKIKPIIAYYNEALQNETNSKESNKRNKKTAVPQQTLTEQDVLSDYKYMPF